MFSFQAARHCLSLHPLRRSLTSLRAPAARYATLRAAVRPQPCIVQQPRLRLVLKRWQSTRQSVGNAARSTIDRISAPLNDLCVYQAGQVRTLFVGMTRVTSIIVFAVGLIYAPSVYYHPAMSNWLVPAAIVGGAVPMVLVALLSAPFVSTVRVQLPARAKRSQEALMNWASNVSPDTRLEIQSMRFLPWPQHKSIRIQDLRRLPQTRWSLSFANLERMPLHGERRDPDKIAGGWLVRRMYARYFIDRAQVTDKSQVPGVWDRIWEQIPVKGQMRDSRPRVQEPVGMANRAQPAGRTSLTGRVRAPPPPAVKVGSKSSRVRR